MGEVQLISTLRNVGYKIPILLCIPLISLFLMPTIASSSEKHIPMGFKLSTSKRKKYYWASENDTFSMGFFSIQQDTTIESRCGTTPFPCIPNQWFGQLEGM
jgi:hypothetical protein